MPDLLPDQAPLLLLALVVGLAGALLGHGALALHRSRRATARPVPAEAGEARLICDGAGRVIAASPAFEALSGHRAAELAGLPLGAVLADADPGMPEEALPPGAALMSLAAKDGRRLPVAVTTETADAPEGRRMALRVEDLRPRRLDGARAAWLAAHDPVTALPNRSALAARLAEAMAARRRTGEKLALLALRLDRFDGVRALLGELAADRLLIELAGRLSAGIRETDTLARTGPDGFMLIARHLSHPGDAEDVARRLLDAVEQPLEAAGHRVALTAAIGVALSPEDTVEPELLERQAEGALARIAAGARGGIAYCRPETEAAFRRRAALQDALRRALPLRQFSLAWMPVATAGEVTGFEALLRWTHPEHGAVPPAEFVPLAESGGTVLALGEWVLRGACAEAASWPRPLVVSVNVSAVQLLQDGFAVVVRKVLGETGLPAARLELEVTERALARDMARALETLKDLRAIGVRVALDDLGTGQSALATLRALPFDRVKLDRSVVAGVARGGAPAGLARGLVGLCHGLGLPLVAEGVETVEQRDELAALGCRTIQGHLLGPAQPIEAWGHVLRGGAEGGRAA